MFILFLVILVGTIHAQQDGWKMTDRFYGFRYELVGGILDVGFEDYILLVADNLGCFGWIQKTKQNTLVGEARCPKADGLQFEQKLRYKLGLSYETNIRVYEDTKIRLHFSHFKILDEHRDTCFLDEPHKCADLKDDRDAQKAKHKDEL